MVLLKVVSLLALPTVIGNLHSNMVLLKAIIELEKRLEAIEFTFQYGSIKGTITMLPLVLRITIYIPIWFY